MAIEIHSHLHRNRHGILYFRLTIPGDLRHSFRRGEIYRSLGTPQVRQATEHVLTLQAAFRCLFNQLRDAIMNNKKHRILEARDPAAPKKD